MSINPFHFPFSALQGQQALQTALLLVAIDPQIGGVLIQGPRGTAKSTSARALADLLPQGEFINLPLGTSEEQLIGTLDIEAALQSGQVVPKLGLLSRAHQGVLYVDEVNLLPDHLVDVLLDVAASGINRIERDSVSHEHESRFVLVGTMNPEEGELRPQLLDRFGLFINLPTTIDVETRQKIVRTRLAFEADPARFMQQQSSVQQAYRRKIASARVRLNGLTFTDQIHQYVSELCCNAQVEGVRGDLVLLRAARAHAALQQRMQIEQEDVDAVADWALEHRRHDSPSMPAQQPSFTEQSRQSSENSEQKNWGELPPQPVPIHSVKMVQALPTKK